MKTIAESFPLLARLSASVLCVAFLLGCATSPPAEEAEPQTEAQAEEAQAEIDEVNDPIEPVNRAIFSFNQFADGILIRPLALMYRQLTPPPLRRSVRNFLNNLNTPVILANDILQGKTDRAMVTGKRFLINSTVGVGGLLDVAGDWGIEGHREDFGQTLAEWGSGEGPYLMLPILGPSNPRDTVGLVVDSFIDPVGYFIPSDWALARTLVRGIDERERIVDALDEIERASLDFYATLRSLYRQRRADEIRDGEPAPVLPIPSLSIDDFEDTDGELITLVN